FRSVMQHAARITRHPENPVWQRALPQVRPAEATLLLRGLEVMPHRRPGRSLRFERPRQEHRGWTLMGAVKLDGRTGISARISVIRGLIRSAARRASHANVFQRPRAADLPDVRFRVPLARWKCGSSILRGGPPSMISGTRSTL